MTATDAAKPLPKTPLGELPPQLRVLFIAGTARKGGWLAEAFASDSASDVDMVEAIGVASGLSRLRDEIFDVVLISHDGEGLDALGLLDAIRAGSSDEQPIIVLGEQSEQEMCALCYEAGGDDYACVNSTTTRTLIWKVARAVERHRLISENRRLLNEQRHQLHLEHEEATRLLTQQRAIIDGLERIRQESSARMPTTDGEASLRHLPESLVNHYREVLRAYVIMGTGNLSDEMQSLAELFVLGGVSAAEVMVLHLHVLEEMVRSLGNRSARHVMSRADLLILEVTVNLAEGYRDRLFKQVFPARQLPLPGFDEAAFLA
ncbi:MAG: hypothetical protein IH991_22810 [Planctomycetes bacterium]|nr:hypothetical protein [Planctomycetota bacterium]